MGSRVVSREAPRDLMAEPGYPGLDTVCFLFRFPELDMTLHNPTVRCVSDCPHAISTCGEWME